MNKELKDTIKEAVGNKVADFTTAIFREIDNLKDKAKSEDFKNDIRAAVTEVLDLALEKVPSTIDTAKDVALDASDAFSNRIDELSGEKMFKEVEERLNQQDKYNDILATKLHESLQRIQDLEAAVENSQNRPKGDAS
jgi:hypothetical protein